MSKTKLRDRFKKKKIKRLEPDRVARTLKRKKIYVKAKCQYVDENGERCRRNAIGKGQNCALHGGTKDLSNVLSPEATQLYKSQYGAITKFLPALHPLQYIDLSRQGLSEVEIAAEIGVGISTIRSWSEKFEEFSVAHEIGKALYESWWLQKGKTGLNSRSFNTSLFKFLTGNKLGYADKVETKNLNMTAHGVLVVPAAQTASEWEAAGIDAEGETDG